MTSEQELRDLIGFARVQGAVAEVECDHQAWISEGRTVIATVRVAGVPGVGPHPMPALHAAERLRSFAASTLQACELGVWETVKLHMVSNVRKNAAQD